MNKHPLIKAILIAVTSLIAIFAVVLVAFLNVDWNRAKPWINAHTSEALGRPFRIAGNVSLSWDAPPGGRLEEGWIGWVPWPRLIADDVHIGNPQSMTAPGGKQTPLPAEMATVKRLTIALDPLPLLDHKIVIPVLHFDSPDVGLARWADGRNNWTLDTDEKSPWRLELKRVVFSKGRVHLTDAINHTDVTMDVNDLDDGGKYGVSWQIHGKFNDQAIDGNGKAGAILSLQHQTAPFPLSANLRSGHTLIALDGTLTHPLDLAALDMQLQVSAVSMAKLYKLSGILLPETEPFSTSGHLIGRIGAHGQHWIYKDFRGIVGSSDINGSFDYQTKQPRPLLSGVIVSHLTQFPDLAPLIGADSNRSKVQREAPTVQPANKALPVEPFKTERWTSIDTDIKFSSEKIVWKKELPITNLTTSFRLKDGVLSLQPLTFEAAGGKLSSDIILDGSGKTVKNAINAKMKMSIRRLNLKQLFPPLQTTQASVGELNGDASLSAVGNSVASLLGASNGEVKTLVNQGTISKLALEEMGMNIGSIVTTQLVGDRQIDLNCMVADFQVTNGVMQARSAFFDTKEAMIDINGRINLAQEQVDLTLSPNSKGLRLLSLRTPIYVRGSFLQPQVSIDKGVMALRIAGAIALAALNPAAAMIPLVKTAQPDDDNCSRAVNAVVTPPPKLPSAHNG